MISIMRTWTERRCSTSSTPPPAVPTYSHFNDNEDNLVDLVEEEDGVDLADEGAVISGPHLSYQLSVFSYQLSVIISYQLSVLTPSSLKLFNPSRPMVTENLLHLRCQHKYHIRDHKTIEPIKEGQQNQTTSFQKHTCAKATSMKKCHLRWM